MESSSASLVMLLLARGIPASLARTALRPIATTALHPPSHSLATRLSPTRACEAAVLSRLLRNRTASMPTRTPVRARCTLCAAGAGAGRDDSGDDSVGAGGAAAGFQALGVHELLLPGLADLGVSSPTEIQSRAWPTVVAGGDAVRRRLDPRARACGARRAAGTGLT